MFPKLEERFDGGISERAVATFRKAIGSQLHRPLVSLTASGEAYWFTIHDDSAS